MREKSPAGVFPRHGARRVDPSLAPDNLTQRVIVRGRERIERNKLMTLFGDLLDIKTSAT